jgi:asparagine synthetase B (glutamine-hydrolysing)
LGFPAAQGEDTYASRNEGELAEELHALLIEATRIRLRADVPVGTYLSGGLDSSVSSFFSHLPHWSRTSRIKALFSADLKRTLAGYDAVEDLRQRLPAEYSSWHPLSQAQYLGTAYLLLNCLVCRAAVNALGS